MNSLISAAISALGVLAAALLLAGAVAEHRSGGSVRWIALGAAVLAAAGYALVRDVRHARSARRRT